MAQSYFLVIATGSSPKNAKLDEGTARRATCQNLRFQMMEVIRVDNCNRFKCRLGGIGNFEIQWLHCVLVNHSADQARFMIVFTLPTSLRSLALTATTIAFWQNFESLNGSLGIRVVTATASCFVAVS
jgi:hypothetical protein